MENKKRKDTLFKEFPPVSSKEWMEKITEDLKGSPLAKITWDTGEGIVVNPFYRKEDLTDKEYLNALPACYPYVRSGKRNMNYWEIRQDIKVTSYTEANQKALHALSHGASAICFIISENLPLNPYDFKALLKDIYINCININFCAPGKESEIIELLGGWVKEGDIDPASINGSIEYDPVGRLSKKGRFIRSEEKDFDDGAILIREASEKMPDLRVSIINGILYHNAGASAIQELGISLACASEYFDRYSEIGLGADQIARSFQLNLAMGPLFFLEIAKIRAARLLFARLINAWKPLERKSCEIFIHSETSAWNQTIFDPYVNLLRGTTEGMAAALGGTDSITILPFDKPFRDTTGFSERIARNTQIILKEEAYLDKVIDPAAGSYYIENITDSFAAKAWEVFLEIEENGGLIQAFKKGLVQDMINKNALRKNMNIAARKEILLGTNYYPDSTENIREDIDPDIAFPRSDVEGNIITPLTEYRGSMALEELRLQTLNHKEGKPKVFLLAYGSLNWRVARASFASGFFGCAGYEIIEAMSFETIKEGIETAISLKASIVVLCSSDDQYPVIAPEAKDLLKSKAILVVAGYPKDAINDLKDKGIEHFIHIKSNMLEELKKFNEATLKSII